MNFIPHAPSDRNGRLDWAALERAGDYKILVPASVIPVIDPDASLAAVKEGLKGFDPAVDAVILLNADPVATLQLGAVLQEMSFANDFDSINVLKYQRGRGAELNFYSPVRVPLAPASDAS